jgi:pyruvate/2-oxoglutarate dehydrogenase complex dihydrolipoamide dehydrogenase (E3) component
VELVVNGKEKQLTVDTILVAIGRDCNPKSLNVEAAGVKFNAKSSKIIGRNGEPERTSVDHIYAVGDIVEGVPELMPVAQKSGKLVAQRMKLRMEAITPESQILDFYSTNYEHIPTTVFSPIEYSYVGLSEEEAIAKHGDENVEVYHKETVPL